MPNSLLIFRSPLLMGDARIAEPSMENNNTVPKDGPKEQQPENGTPLEPPAAPQDLNSARTDYLQWEDYFMALAFLAAKRSKDPCTQVGACLVDKNNKVVGLGYNGFPIGCSDQEFPWRKGGKTDLDSKYMYVCHAEMNAILNRITADVSECTMYVALFPCAECAKLIIQSRISTVVYMSDKHASKNETVASKKMLQAAGINVRQHIPKQSKVVIDFEGINWNCMSQVPPSPAKKS